MTTIDGQTTSATHTATADASTAMDEFTAEQIRNNTNLTIATGRNKMLTRANEETLKQATENIKAAGSVLKEMKFS